MKIDSRPVFATLCAMFCVALSFVVTPPLRAAPAAPAGDVTRGQRLFLQCRACHAVDAAQANGVGPNLSNLIGAKAGTRAGYVYSPAMAKSGIVWNAVTLDRFLTRPSSLVPGTRMAFAGVPAPQNRADLIAYLTTLKAKKR